LLTNQSQPLEVNITNRTGNFADLTAHATATAALSRTLETYSVRILHGEVPSAGGGATRQDPFGYTLYPAITVDAMMMQVAAQSSALSTVNTAALQAVSVCGGGSPPSFGPSSQMQAVFWPSGGGTPSVVAEIAECILGASAATMSVSMPSIVLLKRLNATALRITASGVDAGGPLVVTLAGVSLRCSGENAEVVTNVAMNEGQGSHVATTVALTLPTQANLIGKSVATVCETAAVTDTSIRSNA
jgi:hypothetical protein